MRGERRSGGRDLVYVRVEVALGGGQRAVAGDPAQDMDLDSRVGEPGQSGVPEVVAAQVFVAELGDHVVPVGGVAQDGGGDASAARAGEEAGIGIGAGGQDALGDEGADFLDYGNLAGALALVPLSVSPPGAGVVWRRTVQFHWVVSMSPMRRPEASPMRAAVQAAKRTTSPQPR